MYVVGMGALPKPPRLFCNLHCPFETPSLKRQCHCVIASLVKLHTVAAIKVFKGTDSSLSIYSSLVCSMVALLIECFLQCIWRVFPKFTLNCIALFFSGDLLAAKRKKGRPVEGPCQACTGNTGYGLLLVIVEKSNQNE